VHLQYTEARQVQPSVPDRDILVRIRILESVPLTKGSGCGSGSVPKSSVTFRMQKFYFFHIFQFFNKGNLKALKLLKLCLMIEIKFLQENCCITNFILQPLFQSNQHFYEKRTRSRAGSVLITNGSGCGSRRLKIHTDSTDSDSDADSEH